LAQAKSPRCLFALGTIKTQVRRFGNIRGGFVFQGKADLLIGALKGEDLNHCGVYVPKWQNAVQAN
jgi:hypothetical protein